MKTLGIKHYLLTYGILFFALISSPVLKSQNISTRAEIYDYDVGDVFNFIYTGFLAKFSDTSVTNIEIIDKYYSQNNDILYYVRDVKRKKRDSDEPEWTYEFYIDTLAIHYLDALINGGDIDSVGTDSELYNGRLINYFRDAPDNPPSFTKIKRFVVGCGKAYDYWIKWEGNAWQKTELVYYKKGDEEWGTPVIVSVEDVKESKKKLKIFPNPANSELNISANGFKINNVEIYNASGKLIVHKNFDAGSQKIDVSQLSNGLYILKIKTNDMTVYRKFIKE